MVEVLELLSFVDIERKPNENWLNFQNKSKTTGVMAKSLREAYSFMFERYGAMSNQSDANLHQILMEIKCSKEEEVRAVKMFKTLLQFAGWM